MNRYSVIRRMGPVLLCVFSLHLRPNAELPTLEAIYPAGATAGSTNLVSFSGKFDPWPPKVWVNSPGVAFSAQTNKGKFLAAIATATAAGPRLVRIYNEDGASEPRIFVIGGGSELADSEENNHFAKPQLIDELPITINGRLDKKDDVDSFGLRLGPGQWLEARVDSYTLLSKLDAVLRLVTPQGQQLAWNHDFITLDPRLLWRATNDQLVVVQIFGFPYPADSDVRLAGGETAFYRLHLAASNRPPEFSTPPSEPEPKEASETAGKIEMPGTVTGTICSGIDEDRFRFVASSNQFIKAEVQAAALGSPLDAWLKIENSEGSELARNDDAASRDPRLEWKAPADGVFVLAIGDLTHRGGEEFRYRLSIESLGPDFAATLAASSLVLTNGGTNQLKVNFKRLRGQTNEIAAAFRDLPRGVQLLSSKLVEKEGAALLQLSAGDDAPPFQGPVELFLTDSFSKDERAVPFELTSRTENNGVPGGYSQLLIDKVPSLWLTVRPKPSETTKPEPTAKE